MGRAKRLPEDIDGCERSWMMTLRVIPFVRLNHRRMEIVPGLHFYQRDCIKNGRTGICTIPALRMLRSGPGQVRSFGELRGSPQGDSVGAKR